MFIFLLKSYQLGFSFPRGSHRFSLKMKEILQKEASFPL